MPAHLYVDGYNFYYGVTNHFRRQRDLVGHSLSGLCWCDFRALIERHFLRPGETLGPIRYFTAEVTEPTAVNPAECYNQHLWLDAVRSVPGLDIVYGFHQKPDSQHERQEKQTDANLVVELLLDVLNSRPRPSRVYLLSGDTDYMPAILALEERIEPRCPVTILLPPSAHQEHYAQRFRVTQRQLHLRRPPAHPGFPLEIRQLTEQILANSLLPYNVPSPLGCPAYWRLPAGYLDRALSKLDYHPSRHLHHA
jgi:hypothetical protein